MREPYTIDRQHPSPGFRETLAALGLLFCLCGLACLWLLPAGVGIVGIILCAEVFALPVALILRSEDSMQGGTVVPGEWLDAQRNEDNA